MRDIAYLKLLAREYPTIQSASTEIINLTAIPVSYTHLRAHETR